MLGVLVFLGGTLTSGCARGAPAAPAPALTASPPKPPSASKADAPVPSAAGSAWGNPRESVVARGVLAGSAGVVALFTEVHPCTVERTLPSAQVFVSTDAGKTFSKRGPALEGSAFEFAQAAADGQLWVVGLYTAEGPGIDPFVLVPAAGAENLAVRPVREGPSELMNAARLRSGELLVWLRDIDGPGVGPASGKHIYKSVDQGVTWHESPRLPASSLMHFSKLGNRSGHWRIVERPDGGFEVQHLTKTWQSVTSFPWKSCDR